jgi:hypothetical protein
MSCSLFFFLLFILFLVLFAIHDILMFPTPMGYSVWMHLFVIYCYLLVAVVCSEQLALKSKERSMNRALSKANLEIVKNAPPTPSSSPPPSGLSSLRSGSSSGSLVPVDGGAVASRDFVLSPANRALEERVAKGEASNAELREALAAKERESEAAKNALEEKDRTIGELTTQLAKEMEKDELLGEADALKVENKRLNKELQQKDRESNVWLCFVVIRHLLVFC